MGILGEDFVIAHKILVDLRNHCLWGAVCTGTKGVVVVIPGKEEKGIVCSCMAKCLKGFSRTQQLVQYVNNLLLFTDTQEEHGPLPAEMLELLRGRGQARTQDPAVKEVLDTVARGEKVEGPYRVSEIGIREEMVFKGDKMLVLVILIRVNTGHGGNTEKSLMYRCSGWGRGCAVGRPPIISTRGKMPGVEGVASYFHRGRWPGWLGSNSTQCSSYSGFTYGEASIPCTRIKIAASLVRVVEVKCLSCTWDIPVGRWWWLRKLSRDTRDQTTDWERLDNDSYRTITGTQGG
eukprot:g40360.t1